MHNQRSHILGYAVLLALPLVAGFGTTVALASTTPAAPAPSATVQAVSDPSTGSESTMVSDAGKNDTDGDRDDMSDTMTPWSNKEAADWTPLQRERWAKHEQAMRVLLQAGP